MLVFFRRNSFFCFAFVNCYTTYSTHWCWCCTWCDCINEIFIKFFCFFLLYFHFCHLFVLFQLNFKIEFILKFFFLLRRRRRRCYPFNTLRYWWQVWKLIGFERERERDTSHTLSFTKMGIWEKNTEFFFASAVCKESSTYQVEHKMIMSYGNIDSKCWQKYLSHFCNHMQIVIAVWFSFQWFFLLLLLSFLFVLQIIILSVSFFLFCFILSTTSFC